MFCISWLLLLSLMAFYFNCFLNVGAFDTNLVAEYRWETRIIKYALDKKHDSDQGCAELRSIVEKVLEQFNKDVGPILTWIEIPYAETLNMSRSLIFELDTVECGYGLPAQNGVLTIISLSNATGCDLYTNIAHFLEAFGLLSPHHRKDRDNYVQIHFDNIQPIDHQNHRICERCMTSNDEIFKEYDYLSLLHRPKYSLYAINPDLPIITERNNSISLLPDSYNYTGRTLSLTDIKIFRFFLDFGEDKNKHN